MANPNLTQGLTPASLGMGQRRFDALMARQERFEARGLGGTDPIGQEINKLERLRDRQGMDATSFAQKLQQQSDWENRYPNAVGAEAARNSPLGQMRTQDLQVRYGMRQGSDPTVGPVRGPGQGTTTNVGVIPQLMQLFREGRATPPDPSLTAPGGPLHRGRPIRPEGPAWNPRQSQPGTVRPDTQPSSAAPASNIPPVQPVTPATADAKDLGISNKEFRELKQKEEDHHVRASMGEQVAVKSPIEQKIEANATLQKNLNMNDAQFDDLMIKQNRWANAKDAGRPEGQQPSPLRQAIEQEKVKIDQEIARVRQDLGGNAPPAPTPSGQSLPTAEEMGLGLNAHVQLLKRQQQHDATLNSGGLAPKTDPFTERSMELMALRSRLNMDQPAFQKLMKEQSQWETRNERGEPNSKSSPVMQAENNIRAVPQVRPQPEPAPTPSGQSLPTAEEMGLGLNAHVQLLKRQQQHDATLNSGGLAPKTDPFTERSMELMALRSRLNMDQPAFQKLMKEQSQWETRNERGEPNSKSSPLSQALSQPGAAGTPSAPERQPAPATPPADNHKIAGMIRGSGGIQNLDLRQIQQNVEKMTADGYKMTPMDRLWIERLQGSAQRIGTPDQIRSTMGIAKAVGIPPLYDSGRGVEGMPRNKTNIEAAQKPPGQAAPAARPTGATPPPAGGPTQPPTPANPAGVRPPVLPTETPAGARPPPSVMGPPAPDAGKLMAVTGSGTEIKSFTKETERAQAYMQSMGIKCGPLDGKEGPLTRQGLEEYARKFPTGIENQNIKNMTNEQLMAHMQTRMKSDTGLIKGEQLVKNINSGDAEKIKAGQIVLNAMGYKGPDGKPLPEDGKADTGTRAALAAYKAEMAKNEPRPVPPDQGSRMATDEHGKPTIVMADGSTPKDKFSAATSPEQPKPEAPEIAPIEPDPSQNVAKVQSYSAPVA